LLFIGGHVTEKRIGNGRCLVDMAHQARNQGGEFPSSVVALWRCRRIAERGRVG
jgi:hypothetical protein